MPTMQNYRSQINPDGQTAAARIDPGIAQREGAAAAQLGRAIDQVGDVHSLLREKRQRVTDYTARKAADSEIDVGTANILDNIRKQNDTTGFQAELDSGLSAIENIVMSHEYSPESRAYVELNLQDNRDRAQISLNRIIREKQNSEALGRFDTARKMALRNVDLDKADIEVMDAFQAGLIDGEQKAAYLLENQDHVTYFEAQKLIIANPENTDEILKRSQNMSLIDRESLGRWGKAKHKEVQAEFESEAFSQMREDVAANIPTYNLGERIQYFNKMAADRKMKTDVAAQYRDFYRADNKRRKKEDKIQADQYRKLKRDFNLDATTEFRKEVLLGKMSENEAIPYLIELLSSATDRAAKNAIMQTIEEFRTDIDSEKEDKIDTVMSLEKAGLKVLDSFASMGLVGLKILDKEGKDITDIIVQKAVEGIVHEKAETKRFDPKIDFESIKTLNLTSFVNAISMFSEWDQKEIDQRNMDKSNAVQAEWEELRRPYFDAKIEMRTWIVERISKGQTVTEEDVREWVHGKMGDFAHKAVTRKAMQKLEILKE